MPKDGYLSNKEQKELAENVKQQMIEKGYMTKHKMIRVKLDCKPTDIHVGDLVITYQIFVVRRPFDRPYTKDEFDVAEIIPPCYVDHSNHTSPPGGWGNCDHGGIMKVGAGQQGFAKIIRLIK